MRRGNEDARRKRPGIQACCAGQLPSTAQMNVMGVTITHTCTFLYVTHKRNSLAETIAPQLHHRPANTEFLQRFQGALATDPARPVPALLSALNGGIVHGEKNARHQPPAHRQPWLLGPVASLRQSNKRPRVHSCYRSLPIVSLTT